MVFKIDLFFVSLKEQIPNKSVSEIRRSLPLKTFSSMLWMLSKKIDLSSEKKSAMKEIWTVVSMSLLQQQIGFKQSRKLCLNLWCLGWLKPNLSLVISLIPIGLWQLKVLLGVGRLNCKMLLLKRARLSELLILLRLFHSITVDGKNEFLKKLCLTLNLGMFPIFFLVLT